MNYDEIAAKFDTFTLAYIHEDIDKDEIIDEFTKSFQLLKLFYEFFLDVQDVCLASFDLGLGGFMNEIKELVQGVREEL